MVVQFGDWTQEFPAVSLFTMCAEYAYAYDCPSGRDAPLPCVRPCVLMLTPPPANLDESPNPVRKKNFIFLIAPSIVSTALSGTPNAWKIREAMACAI